MTKIHDKFVVELAEVIKGYGNNPEIEEPFHLSEFYRFYELPEIAIDRDHFLKMKPLEEEQDRFKKIMPLQCLRCKKDIPLSYAAMEEVSYTHYSYCEDCLREGLNLLREKDKQFQESRKE